MKHLGYLLGNDTYLVLVLNFLKRHWDGHQDYTFVLSVIPLDSTEEKKSLEYPDRKDSSEVPDGMRMG